MPCWLEIRLRPVYQIHDVEALVVARAVGLAVNLQDARAEVESDQRAPAISSRGKLSKAYLPAFLRFLQVGKDFKQGGAEQDNRRVVEPPVAEKNAVLVLDAKSNAAPRIGARLYTKDAIHQLSARGCRSPRVNG